MIIAKRLITYADVDPRPREEGISISVRHMLELKDGTEILLLDDRGWGGSGDWADVTRESLYTNARRVVGPDSPPPDRSPEEEARRHWLYLQKIAERQAISIQADELRQLPHDVVIAPRLLARINKDHGGGA